MEHILITTQIIKKDNEIIIKNIDKKIEIITIIGKDLLKNKELSYKLINFLKKEAKATTDDLEIIYKDMEKNQLNSYFLIAIYAEKIIGTIRCDLNENYKNLVDFLKVEKIINEEPQLKIIEKEIDIINKNDYFVLITNFFISEEYRGTVLSNKLIFEIMNILKYKNIRNAYITTNPDKKITNIMEHLFGSINIKLLIIKNAEGYNDNVIERTNTIIKRDYSIIMILNIQKALKNMIQIILNSTSDTKDKNESLKEQIMANKYQF